MIEAVMLWNEPNNLSHWDFQIDPDWNIFSAMLRAAGKAVRVENGKILRVLGGISPIDPAFMENLGRQGGLDEIDVVAVHGFPLDWNHWTIHEWPGKLRHREAEGSAYYRHFYMGLIREDGSPKRAFRKFAGFAPEFGVCQWFHFEDHRLENSVQALRDLGVRHLRTGLSWADYFRPNALQWFDRQMKAIESFEVTLTFCFTPEDKGVRPHHTSPPRHIEEFADFCAEMTRRYAR